VLHFVDQGNTNVFLPLKQLLIILAYPADFQWKPPHDLGAENYMMPPMGPPPSYNPYWNGMQPCMDGFMPPYAGPIHMNMMGYGVGPYDMPSANGMPHDPFGMQGYMMPPITPPPHRYAIFSFFKI
jgi:E3 ubiquitin-protein ligase RBBP6